MTNGPLRTLTATRYVTPLREGGSLPAVVEAEDGRLYVMKFHGAGQGPKALIAELVVGEVGRALGLPVPELVLMHLVPEVGRNEPDGEIQDLLRASVGLNLALAYIDGAFAYDPGAEAPMDPRLASRIVWFDALAMNVDRTSYNTNILVRHDELWLIDHGAALFFHHGSDAYAARGRRPFAHIKDHVLLGQATAGPLVDAELAPRLTPEVLHRITAAVPDDWLIVGTSFHSADEQRAAYRDYFAERLAEPRPFLQEIDDARTGRA